MMKPSPPRFASLKSATSRLAGRRALLAAGLAALVVAGALTWFLSSNGSAESDFLTQEVVLGDVEETVTALGKLQPLQFVDVGTQVSGQLRKLQVTYGETVQQGQLLAEIDPTIYESRMNATQAQLQNFRAQLLQRQAERTLAQQQYARQDELLKENATSQDAFDSAASRLKVATAQIAALEAQLKQTESTLRGDTANLGYTKIYAPMDGTVVDLIAKQGQTLNANQTAPIILKIANLDTMTVWAQVSEADVPRLKLGMRAYFTTLGRSEKRRYGTLRQIIPTPEVVNNVVLYNCLFDVENPDRDLLTQMSAQVYFIINEARNVPIVSVSALRPARGGAARPAGERREGQARGEGGRGRREGQSGEGAQYTVTVLEDGEPVVRPVTVGAMNRLVAEIKSGLEAGDAVVLDAPAGANTQQRQQPPQGGPPGGFGGGGGFRGRP